MTAAFSDCLHVPCPTCKAAVDNLCTFTVNGHTFKRHCPCNERMLAAGRVTA